MDSIINQKSIDGHSMGVTINTGTQIDQAQLNLLFSPLTRKGCTYSFSRYSIF